MDALKLLRENEELKLRLKEMEEKYMPAYNKYIEGVKRAELKKFGINADDWLERINGDTEEEIKASVESLAVDLRVKEKRPYVDPAIKFNGRKRTPKPKGGYEAGQKAFQRLMNNDRYAKKVSSVKADTKHAPAPLTKRGSFLGRVFGRRA